MSIIAKRLSAKKLKASSQVGAQGDIVKGVRYNGQAHYPENDGLINMDTLVQRIDVNGQDVSPDPDGTFPLEDHTGPIKINSEPHFEPIAPSSLNDLGIITRKINLNGTDISPAPTTGITNLGNVAKSYTINGTKTNIGTGGDVSIGNVVQSVNGSTGAITGLAKVVAGGTVNLTWAQVAANATVGLFGDICNRNATLNITGTASATTTYTFDFYTKFNGTLTIFFVNDATAATLGLNFAHINANFVVIQNARTQKILIDQSCVGAFQFHSPYILTPTAASTIILNAQGPNTVFFHVPTYQTPSSTNYGALFAASWGSTIHTSYSYVDSLTGASQCANVSFGGAISFGEVPSVLAYTQTFANYIKIGGRFLFPTTF